MQVIFIHHSCFLLEIDDLVLVFDYFDKDKVDGFHFTGKIPTYEKDTKMVWFASHSHRDHYDMDILRLSEQYPNLQFVFSKDIRISPNFLKKHGIDPAVREKVTFVTGGKNYKVGDLEITTLKSTDAGVAFYVNVHGVQLFHAGDLSDWHMEGAGDLINGRMKRAYRHEINKLSDKDIHIAFVPMDPRLGTHQCDGMDYFLKNTGASYVFPMHLWQDYSGIAEYKKRLTNRGMAERIMDVERENQVFVFSEA